MGKLEGSKVYALKKIQNLYFLLVELTLDIGHFLSIFRSLLENHTQHVQNIQNVDKVSNFRDIFYLFNVMASGGLYSSIYITIHSPYLIIFVHWTQLLEYWTQNKNTSYPEPL